MSLPSSGKIRVQKYWYTFLSTIGCCWMQVINLKTEWYVALQVPHYSYKTFFACSQVFPLVAEVFLFVSRTAPSLWIIFCPFVSYNVNWHEDNLSVDQEHRWFVRGEGKFVFHEITSSAVCRWETCCGNILLLAWTPSSSSKCIKARFLFILNLSFYYSSYVGLEFW